jgi:hypothetical protein
MIGAIAIIIGVVAMFAFGTKFIEWYEEAKDAGYIYKEERK